MNLEDFAKSLRALQNKIWESIQKGVPNYIPFTICPECKESLIDNSLVYAKRNTTVCKSCYNNGERDMPDSNPTICPTVICPKCGRPISGENAMVLRSLDVFCKKCYQAKIQEKIKDGINIHICCHCDSSGTMESVSTPLKVVPPGHGERFIPLCIVRVESDDRESK